MDAPRRGRGPARAGPLRIQWPHGPPPSTRRGTVQRSMLRAVRRSRTAPVISVPPRSALRGHRTHAAANSDAAPYAPSRGSSTTTPASIVQPSRVSQRRQDPSRRSVQAIEVVRASRAGAPANIRSGRLAIDPAHPLPRKRWRPMSSTRSDGLLELRNAAMQRRLSLEMSAITNLYAGVPVADLDASIDWYTRALRPTPRHARRGRDSLGR